MKYVVFSHGYGVKKDSKGLFSAIAQALPRGFTPIMFDYYEISGDNMKVRPPSVMSSMFREKCSGVKSDELILIGHSMGCSILAMSGVKAAKAILIAPPSTMTSKIGYRNRILSHHPDAKELNGSIHIPRKNGGIFEITPEWVNEMETLTHGDCILELVERTKTCCIFGSGDEQTPIPNREHPLWKSGARIIEIPGDHNFTGAYRQKAVHEVIEAVLPS